MKTPPKIVSSLMVLVVLIALSLFLVYFFLQQIQNQAENLIFQKTQLVEIQSKDANLKKFQEKRQLYQESLAKIDQLFVNPAEPLDFIEFLEKESALSKLAIEITPLSPLNFALSLQGDPPGFFRFLEKLEKAPYLIEILNLNLLNSEKNNFKATLSLKVYSQ